MRISVGIDIAKEIHWVTAINADGVVAHSIIAVQRDGPPEQGDDGVVKYLSARIDGVASEKIVRSSHSTQGHPETIQEVKRILFERTERLPVAADRAVSVHESVK